MLKTGVAQKLSNQSDIKHAYKHGCCEKNASIFMPVCALHNSLHDTPTWTLQHSWNSEALQRRMAHFLTFLAECSQNSAALPPRMAHFWAFLAERSQNSAALPPTECSQNSAALPPRIARFWAFIAERSQNSAALLPHKMVRHIQWLNLAANGCKTVTTWTPTHPARPAHGSAGPVTLESTAPKFSGLIGSRVNQ
jgi:hypothetical protein